MPTSRHFILPLLLAGEEKEEEEEEEDEEEEEEEDGALGSRLRFLEEDDEL